MFFDLSHCPICSELAGLKTSRVAELGLGSMIAPNRVLESANLAAIASLGPLVTGHTLVVSREHRLSFGAHGLGKIGGELDGMLCRIASLLEQAAEGFLVFEHGSTRPDNSLCSTAHAHLHVLPLPLAVIDQVLDGLAKLGARSIETGALVSAAEEAADFIVAFRYGGHLPECVRFLNAAGLPSQVVRRLVANALGRESWNWRDNLALESFAATAALLQRD